MKKECICVFAAGLARHLLKLGYQIVDVKPDKLDEENKRSVFVFKNDDGLIEEIYNYTN